MTIISVSGYPHNIETQSHRNEVWLDGYIEVPKNLINKVIKMQGFFDLILQDDVLIDVIENKEKYEEYTKSLPATDSRSFDGLKEEKIQKSKLDLEEYLKANPLTWTDGCQYSITREKQQQLTSKLAVAQAKATLGLPYDLKWNTTDEVCTPWEISDLYSLAFTIDERVTALVAYQQAQEVAIRNVTTIEELNAIEVNYDKV